MRRTAAAAEQLLWRRDGADIDANAPCARGGEVGTFEGEEAAEEAAALAGFSRERDAVLVLPRHHGFGCAVRAALRLLAPATSAAAAATRAHAPTPYVMVVQHDNNFVRGFPLADVLAAMRRDPAVLCKVDVLSSTTLRYADGAASKVSAHVKLEPYTYGGGVGRGSAAVVNGGGVEADGELRR